MISSKEGLKLGVRNSTRVAQPTHCFVSAVSERYGVLDEGGQYSKAPDTSGQVTLARELSQEEQRNPKRNTAGSFPGGQPCPLCNISQGEVLAEFQRWKLVRTKTMKGHKERLMLFYKEHVKTLDEQSIGEAYILLSKIGSKFFSYIDKWAIFEPIYATVPDHWHRVASDLDANAQDYGQILKTPRMIIDNHEGTISRVYPDDKSPGPP